MPRFFIESNIEPNDAQDSFVTITGDDAKHIGFSLRMKVGETICVCTPDKTAYTCELCEIKAESVKAKVISSMPSNTEPPYFARLFMALPKGDKMEYIIQKSIECGVGEIIPFSSERTIVKLDEKSAEKKRERWQKIAENAASQSRRGIIPKVLPPVKFEEAIEMAAKSKLAFLCWEDEKTLSLPELVKSSPDTSDISFIVGAEGGLSIKEAQKAKDLGIKSVSLGNRILRCESAPPFVLACLSCLLEF